MDIPLIVLRATILALLTVPTCIGIRASVVEARRREAALLSRPTPREVIAETALRLAWTNPARAASPPAGEGRGAA